MCGDESGEGGGCTLVLFPAPWFLVSYSSLLLFLLDENKAPVCTQQELIARQAGMKHLAPLKHVASSSYELKRGWPLGLLALSTKQHLWVGGARLEPRGIAQVARLYFDTFILNLSGIRHNGCPADEHRVRMSKN